MKNLEEGGEIGALGRDYDFITTEIAIGEHVPEDRTGLKISLTSLKALSETHLTAARAHLVLRIATRSKESSIRSTRSPVSWVR
jgi:hypothetical protein